MSDQEHGILGTVHIYRGEFHKGMRGWRVVVVSVLRGEELLTREDEIGELREGDRLEVRPIIDGRLSFVSYDAAVVELEASGETWGGTDAEPFLVLGHHDGGGLSEGATCHEIETATYHACRIAKTELGIETLETRHRDRLDFHEVSVASVKAALLAAFEAGRRSERGQAS